MGPSSGQRVCGADQRVAFRANESDVEEMELNDAFIIPVGEVQQIEQPQPANYPDVP
jgi:hypothetical protein